MQDLVWEGRGEYEIYSEMRKGGSAEQGKLVGEKGRGRG